MNRVAFGVLIYLLLAVALETAVLPPLRIALPGGPAAMFDWRLMAMAGIMAGLLLGETAGLVTAILAAGLSGCAQPVGALGASLVSFTIAGYVAGVLSRPMRPQGGAFRFIVLAILLAMQQAAWAIVRKLYWPAMPIDVPWLGLTATLLIAAVLSAVLAPALRLRGGRAD